MKYPILTIDPNEIYFTHSKIRKQFTGCNKLITETLSEIMNGTLSIDHIPKISVFKVNSYYVSLNNRRLYLFKELHKQSKIKSVDVYIRDVPPKYRNPHHTFSLQAKAILN